MLRRIPKVLLLVALLTALVASSAPTFANKRGRNSCILVGSTIDKKRNCRIDKNGNCSSQRCKPGEPCNDSICGFGF